MALIPGTRLGPYEITDQIGVGGMGEVYRAMDTRLKRAVAIKVLPAGLTSDVGRLARFHREAEVLASLNHPHIAQIHGLEKSGGITALVMELVEGDDLAQRLARGAIPLDEALPIGRQIAEALEAAHEQGIIHRDLKPANIKVRPDGTVKVLDFGLAKALDPASGGSPRVSDSPTITWPATMTGVGVLLGTAAYMSPEQARGKPVDKRADIWAFGCVLYEMLTGKRAFKGQHVSEILVAILRDEPDGSALPADTPTAVRKLLRRCLEKERGRRWQSAGDVRLEIEDATGAHAADLEPRVPFGRRSVPLWVAAFAGMVSAVAAALVGVSFGSLSGPQELPGVARMALPLSPGAELREGPSVVISPDGKQVAYVASRAGISELYIRPIESFETLVVPNTRGASAPFFSPDGRWLGFFADAKLKKVSVSGGVVETLADAGSAGGISVSAVWRPNDTIVFRGLTTIMEIAAAGGDARPLLTPEQLRVDGAAWAAEVLPGDDALLVTSTRPGGSTDADRSIDVLTTATGNRRVVIQGGTSPHYLPTGHIAFLRHGTLMAVPFDARRLELAGTPVEVLTGVRQPFNGLGAFSCSGNGTCVYVAGGTVARRTVTLVDRAGAIRPLVMPPKSYGHPRFSPTGNKVSFWIEQIRCEIVVYDVERATLTKITADGDNHFPTWAPDGERIMYLSHKTDDVPGGFRLFSQLANGGGGEMPLGTTRRTLGPLTSLSESRAGILALADRGDIWLLARSGDGDPTPFAPSGFNETMPAFSPEGRRIAYVSDESGQLDVYVRPFPGPGEKHRVSTDGGTEPVWARSGRELFFRSGNRMMAVDVATTRTFGASRPRLLFTAPFARSEYGYSYDVSPDGQSFVVVNAGEGDYAATQVNVLTNWFEEVKRLVPTK